MRAPAIFSCVTTGDSSPAKSAGGSCEPARVSKPVALKRSFTPTGMPNSAGRLSGSGNRSSNSSASYFRRARRLGSGSSALTTPSIASMRSQIRAARNCQETRSVKVGVGVLTTAAGHAPGTGRLRRVLDDRGGGRAEGDQSGADPKRATGSEAGGTAMSDASLSHCPFHGLPVERFGLGKNFCVDRTGRG